MSFELDPSLPTTKAIRKVARKRIDAALEQLDSIDGADQAEVEAAVHAARKRCKEARTVARLVRASIGRKRFRSFNSTVREAAHLLGPIRDSHAIVATFDHLLEVHELTDDEQLHRVRSAQSADADRITARAVHDGELLDNARRLLESARHEIRRWRLGGGFEAVADGIETVYRDGRKALTRARKQATDESVHELRKAVKHLFHAIKLVESSAPSVLSPLVDQLDHLGDALGDDHDLAVLVARLGEGPGAERAIELARRQQAELRWRAFRLAATIYAEGPREVRTRVERYWLIAIHDGPELATGTIAEVAEIAAVVDQTGT